VVTHCYSASQQTRPLNDNLNVLRATFSDMTNHERNQKKAARFIQES
jgi:hypothetical protein